MIRRPARLLLGALLLLAAAPPPPPPPPRPWPGINLSGAEFGAGKLPGHPGTDYTFPAPALFDWVAARGFRVVRLPVLWERLQPELSAPLDPGELGRLRAAVDAAGARSLSVIVDIHNYGKFRGKPIGAPEVPPAAFADLWRRLAAEFAANPRAIFGLMNEPQLDGTLAWRDAVGGALDAIRAAGARNLVLVPGAGWDGAHSFTAPRADGVSNAQAMADLTDPAGNMAFEVHQYLDADYSGTHPSCPAADRIEALLQPVTDWLRAGGRRAVLGEFAGSAQPDCLDGLRRLLGVMDANPDAWLGWTWWAAGAWWPADYPFLLQGPDGRDRPQLRVLFPQPQPPPQPPPAPPP